LKPLAAATLVRKRSSLNDRMPDTLHGLFAFPARRLYRRPAGFF
jgi:hypothetical protein